MKKLGFGLMRLPRIDKDNPASIDIEQVKEMVDLFMEKGFTYFDTAWMYNGYASEKAVKTALVERYTRNSFTIATKLHAGYINSPEDRDKIFNAQLEKTGAGYFDYYLLHGVEESMYQKYEQLDCFNWLLEKKAKGPVRHAGFSFHGKPELLNEILTKYPEMEFVQLQINYLDWESPWIHSRGCYETAVKHNKPVIVMEPVKGGTLSKLPAKAERLLKEKAPDMSIASWAIRFAASLPGVMTVLSGMSDIAQVKDNIGYMENLSPLSEEEKELCFKAAEIINKQTAIPCTGCSYCTDGCPSRIAIPQYFSLYNEDMRERLDEKGWTVNFTNYDILSSKFGRASDCIGCGQCESVCPQHLPVIENLKKLAEHYGK